LRVETPERVLCSTPLREDRFALWGVRHGGNATA
jgi:hypothetical protein